MIIIGQTTNTSSVKHFFVLLRSNIFLLRLEKMMWSYPIFVFLIYNFIDQKSEVRSTPVFSRMEYIFKIILFDYKLNNILNKQSLLFETLSSNGYVLYIRYSYLHGQMVWTMDKPAWRSDKKQTKIAIFTLNTLTCSNYVSF